MCKWLEDAIDFWFPEPVEVDMDGDIELDIPETVSDSALHLEELDNPVDIPETVPYDWDAGFTLKIPGFYRVEPAVKEAQLIVQGKSLSRPITDGRVVR